MEYSSGSSKARPSHASSGDGRKTKTPGSGHLHERFVCSSVVRKGCPTVSMYPDVEYVVEAYEVVLHPFPGKKVDLNRDCR